MMKMRDRIFTLERKMALVRFSRTSDWYVFKCVNIFFVC